jgi:lactoylglutathione lyase
MRIDAIGLFANDMKTLVEFYRDVVGMKIEWNGEPYAEFQMDSGSRLIMYGRKDFEEMISQKLDFVSKINGAQEIALNFPNFSDVDKEFNRMIKLGATPVFHPTTMPWGQRTSYIADPDGNLIEIGSFNNDN